MCNCVWISLTLYHNDSYHKGKSGNEFGGICTKHAGIRVNKGANNEHFSSFQSPDNKGFVFGKKEDKLSMAKRDNSGQIDSNSKK